MEAMRQMPQYQCHKKVWALKIAAVGEGTANATLSFEDAGFAPHVVSNEFLRKHQPKPGGYFVVYEDGYESFSPAKAFEDGYTRIGRTST